MQPSSFDTTFAALTDAGRPFPWLGELFKRFISDEPDNIPASWNLPTDVAELSVAELVSAPKNNIAQKNGRTAEALRPVAP